MAMIHSQEEVLRKKINLWRIRLPQNEFFFQAGRTLQYIYHQGDEEGNDMFNACLGGLIMFEDFIFEREDDTDRTEKSKQN